MKICVWKKNYQDISVFIRNFGEIWEYLFAWNGQIFNAHIVIKPGWKKLFSKEKYDKKMIEQIIKVVFIMAKATLDQLMKKNEK